MPDTPTPETPAELAAKAKQLADSLRYSACPSKVMFALHAVIDRLESLATLAASSTAPDEARNAYGRLVQHLATIVQLPARTLRGKGEVEFIERERVMGSVVAMRRAADDLIAAAPAAAERKPFTLQAIHALMSQTFADDSELTDAELTLIRAVERAHGITAAPAGSEGE